MAPGPNLYSEFAGFATKNTELMIISMEMVHKTK